MPPNLIEKLTPKVHARIAKKVKSKKDIFLFRKDVIYQNWSESIF